MSKVPVFTPAELKMVRDSYAEIEAQGERAAAVFYQRVFALNPALRGLFHGDMREQGRKLIATLGLISTAADKLDELVPTLRQLGVRHMTYRVQEAHYGTVGSALLAMIEDVLGPSRPPELRLLWAKLYAFISGQMISGAREQSQESNAAP